MKNNLWTKDFTIITLGTVVSMLGNSMSGFAIGLLVLDYTESTFLFAFFMVAYQLPKLIMPLISGPYIDKFSRKKIIYGFDFMSAGIYLIMGILIYYDLFSYGAFLLLAILIGSIDSVYSVAYDSLYPTLIKPENYQKAYSVSSIIYPLSAAMIPVAAFLYDQIGLAPIFFINTVTFLIAAVFETQIKGGDGHIIQRTDQFTVKEYIDDFKKGLQYIMDEKGLLVISAYFCITTFSFGATNTVILPFFRNTPGLGVQLYTWVMGCGILGRVIGGLMKYKIDYPGKIRFTIAMSVYLAISILEGGYLFLPINLMMICSFLTGLFSVTSYNIRIASTQSYVPDSHRGRFNGTFMMVTSAGGMLGQILSGALAEFIPFRAVIVIFMGINLVGAMVIMYRGRKHVKPIYNNETILARV